MAYRNLYVGDLVRVIDSSSALHGFNAVVIHSGDGYCRVQHYHEGDSSSRCYDIPNRKLLVRHSLSEFIVDGRIDHAAKAEHESMVNSIDDTGDDNDVEENSASYYDDWSHEELVDQIIHLHEVIGTIMENS